MQRFIQTVRKWEFEARIFISLCIVLFVCFLSYGVTVSSSSNFAILSRGLGISQNDLRTIGFIIAALVMVLASLLRMWAGSVLSSKRVMAFRVQFDALLTQGPYLIVRNPIYFADLLAMCGFALCLPPAGLLLPPLIYVHYVQLVKYEENSLVAHFKEEFHNYAARVPRLVPNARSIVALFRSTREFRINRDGFRNNALYLLFVAGFVVAAFTGQFFHAVIIGLPAVLDWSVIHTKKGLPKSIRNSSPKDKSKKVFEDILYAQCWEDPQIDRIAFRINPEDIVFTITSGGCNALTFLLDNPRKVIALDVNPYQNFLLELKIAAFKQLTYDEMLEFVGIRISERRLELYDRLRDSLSAASRTYWDAQSKKVSRGIIHAGRFESYMRLLGLSLRCVVGRATIEDAFELNDAAARADYYHNKWETIRWHIFTKILLSRRVMTVLFDKAFFHYLESSFSFGNHFAGRTEYALTRLPMRENYFISYILLGRYYSEKHLPPYLRPENYDTIRNRLDRIEIVTDSCEHFFGDLPDNCISKFNFTNIFEWMSPEAFEALLRETIRIASRNAVLTYRNLLVFRQRPAALADHIRPWRDLSKQLHLQDLSFIYSNYVVEQVRKENKPWNTLSRRYVIEKQ